MKLQTRSAKLTLVALLLAAPFPAAARAAEEDTTALPVLRIALRAPDTIPAGTTVPIALKQTLRSGTAKKGEAVAWEVAQDVTTPGPDGQSVVLLPKGTPAWGTVVESHGGRAFGKPGRLRLTCDYILLSDNTRVPLRPSANAPSARGRSRGGAAVVSGTLVGLGVGFVVTFADTFTPFGEGEKTSPAGTVAGLASGVLIASLWRGGNVTLPEGKTFALEVAADMPLAATAAPVPAAPSL